MSVCVFNAICVVMRRVIMFLRLRVVRIAKKDGSNAKQMFSRITGLTASRIMQHIATRNNRVKHATSVPG